MLETKPMAKCIDPGADLGFFKRPRFQIFEQVFESPPGYEIRLFRPTRELISMLRKHIPHSLRTFFKVISNNVFPTWIAIRKAE